MVAIVGTAHSVVPADIDLLLGGLAHTVEIIFMVHDLLQAHCNAVGALQAKKTIAIVGNALGGAAAGHQQTGGAAGGCLSNN